MFFNEKFINQKTGKVEPKWMKEGGTVELEAGIPGGSPLKELPYKGNVAKLKGFEEYTRIEGVNIPIRTFTAIPEKIGVLTKPEQIISSSTKQKIIQSSGDIQSYIDYFNKPTISRSSIISSTSSSLYYTKPKITSSYKPVSTTSSYKPLGGSSSYKPIPYQKTYKAYYVPEQKKAFDIPKYKKKKKAETAFNIEIKEKDKWVSQNVALSEKQAGLLAQERLRRSLVASARLVPTRKAIQQANIRFAPKQGEFRQYQISKDKKIFNPRLFIQETGGKSKGFSRLGTRAEKTEIQIAKATISQVGKKNKGGYF
jgi:hypothetical protein